MTTLPHYVTNPTSAPARATLDSETKRIVLPLDAVRAAFLVIEGIWGDDEYGPGACRLELKSYSKVPAGHPGARWGAYTLTKNAAFALPEATDRIELEVVDSVPGLALTLAIYQEPAKRAPATSSAPPVPVIPAARAVRPTTPAPPSVEHNATTPASQPPFRRPRGQRGGRNRRTYASRSYSSVTPNAPAHR